MTDTPFSPVAAISLADGVAQIVVDAPPVNALSQAVRRALVDMIGWAETRPDVRAIVIRCAGRTFFAGADIREFGKAPTEPYLPDVVNRIESCRKPVIAAIHGNALGGGLEVALGCHFRVALAASKLGFPEVGLGLIPGAGGTQRLPRLVAMSSALDLLAGGKTVTAAQALGMGLIDLAITGDLKQESLAFAHRVVEAGAAPVRTSERTEAIAAARTDFDIFDRFLTANAKRFRGFHAPPVAVAAARAAVELPFAEGLAAERASFLKLLGDPQAAALRHVFFAEREAAKIPGLPDDLTARPICSVGIVGAGTMGTGIALNFLLADMPVILVETRREALDRGVATIEAALERNVGSGRLASDKARQARDRLSPTLEFADLVEADLIIEAAYETMDVKREIFKRLDRTARRGAILATNTSYLDVDAIAAVTDRPQDVLGLHFFSPANIMKLLEVVRGEKTADDVLLSGLNLAKRIGKIAVVAGVAHGFIGNRMLHARRQAVEQLLLGGINPYRIDAVLEQFGMPMGPFRMYDLAGLDLGWSPELSKGATIQERLCENGRRGQKTGAGYYDYDANRAPLQSEETLALIKAYVVEQGAPFLDLTDTEILERALYPMINEGFRILDEGKAYRASDIDIVWINGYGWPAYRGGPMYYAGQIGPRHIVDALASAGSSETIAEGLRQAAL
jgi:3-hydroxyacyl-CoA dehydrogenase